MTYTGTMPVRPKGLPDSLIARYSALGASRLRFFEEEDDG